MSVIAERYECKKTQNMAGDIGEAWLGWYFFFLFLSQSPYTVE